MIIKKYIPFLIIVGLFTLQTQAHEIYISEDTDIDGSISKKNFICKSLSNFKESELIGKIASRKKNVYTKAFYEMTSQDILFSVDYAQDRPRFMSINESLLGKLSSTYENDFLAILSKRVNYASTDYFKSSLGEIQEKIKIFYQYLSILCQDDVMTCEDLMLYTGKLSTLNVVINSKLERLKNEFKIGKISLSEFNINQERKDTMTRKSKGRVSFKRQYTFKNVEIVTPYFLEEEKILSV